MWWSLYWLNALSLAWLGGALSLVIYSPQMTQRAIADWATPAIITTIVAISVNLVVAFGVIIRRRSIFAAFPRTVIVLALISVLLVQIAYLRGMEHYSCSTAPGPEDWAVFMGAHLLRAADMLDVIDRFDWQIQAIHHRSEFTSAVLFGFHLICGLVVLHVIRKLWLGSVETSIVRYLGLGLFILAVVIGILGLGMSVVFIALLPEWRIVGLMILAGISLIVILLVIFAPVKSMYQRWHAFWHDENDEQFYTGLGAAAWIGLIVVTVNAWLEGLSEYSATDLQNWVLDSALRVIDFADVMIIYDLHVYELPHYWWSGWLTIILRLVVAVVISVLLWGISRLWKTTKPETPPALRIESFPPGLILGTILGSMAVFVPYLTVTNYGEWTKSVEYWAEVMDDPKHAADADAALRRLGPHAAAALPILIEKYPRLDSTQQARILILCGVISPEPLMFMEENLTQRPEQRQVVIDSLAAMRPLPIAFIAERWSMLSEDERRIFLRELSTLRRREMPVLINQLAPENAPEFVPVIERLEPQWYYPPPEREIYEAHSIRDTRILLAMLQNPLISPVVFEPRKEQPPTIEERLRDFLPLIEGAGDDHRWRVRMLDSLDPNWRKLPTFRKFTEGSSEIR